MLVSLSLGAQAQTQPQDTTMNRTVVVEQEYNPDIMDASKVNVLPRVEPPTVSKKAVEYDATLMPATHIPAGIMQAYTGKETQAKALPGYVRLGYGNYGNLDVRANYLFSLSPKDRLNLTFTMDGMDGFQQSRFEYCRKVQPKQFQLPARLRQQQAEIRFG